MEELTKRFNKLYHKILVTIQPMETAAMVAYSTAFESDFAFSFRERRYVALLVKQADAVALEGNLIVVGKIKRIGPQCPEEKNKEKKEKKRTKDEPESSSSVKESLKAKIEEISSIIHNLSKK